jgi:hypothetical protein
MPNQEYRKLGSFTMDSARRKAIRHNFKKYKSSQTAATVRIGAITGTRESWGVSADENVRTQILRTKFNSMTKREARWAYHQRSHQGVLVYRTNSRTLRKTYGTALKTPRHGISAHTPGIKTQVVKGTKGALTEEHGTRDNLRAQAVEKTLSDPKRHYLDTATMGKLGTIQLMMSPQEEFSKARKSVTSGSTTIHSVFPKIGEVSKKRGFDRMASTVNRVREREKLVSATMLQKAGRDNLVPAPHKKLLKRNHGDIDGAMDMLERKSQKTSTSFPFNSASYSKTDRLDERSVRRMDRDAGNNKRARALSPPRRIEPKPKGYPFG